MYRTSAEFFVSRIIATGFVDGVDTFSLYLGCEFFERWVYDEMFIGHYYTLMLFVLRRDYDTVDAVA